MTELSLFSGAGGGLLGTKLLGFKCVGYVEQDEYCQRVLRARIRDGFLDDAPIFSDVRAFNGLPYRGRVDCVSAGFPCQPFSVAGRKQGADDARNLWPDTVRIIGEVRPSVALLENVPGLISSGYFGTILSDLAEAGYDVRWLCLSAGEVGAPHIRKRLWILATDADREHLRQQHRGGLGPSGESSILARGVGAQEPVADADCERKPQPQGDVPHERRRAANGSWWNSEPAVGRVVDGLANRLVQLRALGNGQVPRVVVEAWERLTTEAA